MAHPDTAALAWAATVLAGQVKARRFHYLDSSRAFANETNPQIWIRMMRDFKRLRNRFDGGSGDDADAEIFKAIQRLTYSVTGKIAEDLGWEKAEGESHFRGQLRAHANADNTRVEVAALRHAETAGLPVPEVLGHDDGAAAGLALTLTSYLAGSSRIPVEPDGKRLRTLGAAAARISVTDVPSLEALPQRTGPIGDVNWVGLRREHGASPALRRAEEAVERAEHADNRECCNTHWDGTKLTAILDWDASGIGFPGIDLGSLRFDAALRYGLPAVAEVWIGWEDEAGRTAADVAYWDAVAALASPPDMGWSNSSR
ncbi:hypothetical protein K4F52_009765 [Lecanicillium sp. MT-2017a]|nr:hypothetical protein K4F52_009765 [Lecanicillium sp. MT-2017a]